MAKHTIEVSHTSQVMSGKDMVIVIHADGEKLGQMQLPKGGVDWWPRNSKTKHHTCTWEQLRDFMESLPRRG